MFQNKNEQSQLNETNSLDMDNKNKTHIPKTLNTAKQSLEKNSYNGTSISSNYKNKKRYSNLVNKIKLNYHLYHPKQRIQTIILHSNLDKSVNMSDSSLIDFYLKNDDISGNINDNINTGFALDNSGNYSTNNNNRNTLNVFNRTQLEQLIKGHEEERNNQSAENKKNLKNYNFTNDFLSKYNKNNINNTMDNNNIDKNVKVNLGNVFQGINDINNNPQKDNMFISQNNNYQEDNHNWNNEETDDGTSTNNNDKFPYSSNTFKNNNIISQDLNNIKRKEFNMNNKNNINDLSTNMYSNSTKDDNNFQFGQNKINCEKDIISSFNSGISNQNNYSFPYLKNSCNSLNNEMNGNMNESINDGLGTKFTFKQQESNINDSQYSLKQYKRNSLPQNIPQNKLIDINEIHDDSDKIHETNYLSHEGNNKNKIREIFFNKNPKKINNSYDKDNLENNNEEYIEYNNIEDNQQYSNNNNIYLASDKKNNIPQEKNNNEFINNINKEANENLLLTVTESDEETENNGNNNKIFNRKSNNLLKSFLYGLLFGSTVSGIFWLKNEGTRKYFLEKMKGINFNSIFSFLKRLFSNPIKFFKQLFCNERMKDYIKVFGITFGNFLDIFEKYDDWFRFIGIVLCIYLIWILIKSFIRTFLKLWKENN